MLLRYSFVVLAVTSFTPASTAGRSAELVIWAGVVRSVAGLPVADATINVIAGSSSGLEISSVTSGPDGSFTLVLGSSPWKITVFADGYSAWLASFSGAELPPREIVLASGRTVLGTVTDGSGLRAPGVFVDIVYDVSRLPLRPMVDTHGGARVTGADGFFRVTNVIPDIPFLVELSRGAAVIGRFGPYVAGARTELPLHLRIPALAQVRGVTTDLAAVPINDATVRLMRLETDSRFPSAKPATFTTRTNGFGSFVFPPGLPGEFRLIVAKPGFRTYVGFLAVDATSAASVVRIALSR